MDKLQAAFYLKKIRMFLLKTAGFCRNVFENVKLKITAWWQWALGILAAILFLYYPIGGWMINCIDTSSAYQPESKDGNLATIDMISHLINREVHEKMWTPNLPFLFPCYFLDNMPNFQLGLMSGVERAVTALDAAEMPKVSIEAKRELNEAAELLRYPGNIWLFSPDNKLVPVPSANTQYKKGRKKLNNFNHEMAMGKVIWPRSANNLLRLLKIVRKDILNQVGKTESHVRENQKNWTDFAADDVFYFSQGKLYAYARILNAAGIDFKNVLVKYGVYEPWTAMLKSLEAASDINPAVIRNAKVNSSLAPNHLISINYYAAKAVNQLDNVINLISMQKDKGR